MPGNDNRRINSYGISYLCGKETRLRRGAMNTDNYYSNSVELTRRFVYLYHLAIFFFCSGYLIRVRSVKYIILKFLKQYKMFLLICFSSFILLPLWVKTGTVTWSGYHEIVVKVKNIMLFR